MCPLGLLLLKHAKHYWTKTVEIYREEKKKGRRRYKGKVLPFSEECAVFCFFMLSLCQVLTCSLSICPQALTGKVNIPLPPSVSLSHTHAYCTHYCFTACYDLRCPTSLFLLLPPSALIHLILFSHLYFYLALSQLHSHTYLHSVGLSAPLLTLGTGGNTLEGLQCLAQLQLAVVLNRMWLN